MGESPPGKQQDSMRASDMRVTGILVTISLVGADKGHRREIPVIASDRLLTGPIQDGAAAAGQLISDIVAASPFGGPSVADAEVAGHYDGDHIQPVPVEHPKKIKCATRRKGFILLSALADKFNNGEDCGVYEETLGGLDYVEPECHTVHETGFRTEFKTECGKVHSRVCQTSYRTVCDHGATSECKVKYSKVCSTGTEVQCSPVCTTQYTTVCSPQAGYSGDSFSAPAQGYVTPESSYATPGSSYATPESSYGPAQECQEVPQQTCEDNCAEVPIQNCVEQPQEVCEQVPVQDCRLVPQGTLCADVPEKQCRQKAILKPQTVSKTVCNRRKDEER